MGILSPFKKAGKYTVRGAIATGAEIEISPTSDALVQLEVTTVSEKAVKIEILVDGVRIANNEIPATVKEAREVPLNFIVPAGKKFQVVANTGIGSVNGNSILLN